MKKKLILLILALMFLPTCALAKDYNITNLYIEAEIDENNIYNITEYYNVYFDAASSFKRKIPLQQTVLSEKNKKLKYAPTVSDIKIDGKYTVNNTSKNREIVFEREDSDTNTTYLLNYKYNMGRDLDNKSDIVYLSFMDSDNASKIEQMSFSVTVKDASDLKNIKFYSGNVDITDKIDYQVSNDVINGIVNTKVLKGNVLSLRVVLDQGYFKDTMTTTSYLKVSYIIFSIIVLVLTFMLYKKYHERKKIDVDIDDLTSLECAYLFNGKMRMVDVVSLIFTLSCEGYITIKNYGSGEKSEYKLIKVKEYDGINAGKKIVFDGIFQNKDEVDATSINGIFLPYLEDLRQIVESKKNRLKLFYPNIKKKKNILLSLIALAFTVSQIDMLYYLGETYLFAFSISIVLGIILYVLLSKLHGKYFNFIYALYVVLTILGIYALLNFKINLIIYLINNILFGLITYFYQNILLRTPYGSAAYDKVSDLKHRLMTSNLNETKENVAKDSNYVYNMIPYAVTFGVTKWWLTSRSEYIKEKPFWYTSSEPYTPEKLSYCIDKIVATLTICMQTDSSDTDELLHQAPNKLL